MELATHKIKVVNVARGAIARPIKEETSQIAEKRAAPIHEIPERRTGMPEEVARLVSYLAGDDASYITGTTIVIDGGLMRMAGAL